MITFKQISMEFRGRRPYRNRMLFFKTTEKRKIRGISPGRGMMALWFRKE